MEEIDSKIDEINKTFEKLQNIVNSPIELSDPNLKIILTGLLSNTKFYNDVISRFSTVLDLHYSSLEKITLELIKNKESYNTITDTLNNQNDSIRSINNMIKDHTEMFNMLTDKLKK